MSSAGGQGEQCKLANWSAWLGGRGWPARGNRDRQDLGVPVDNGELECRWESQVALARSGMVNLAMPPAACGGGGPNLRIDEPLETTSSRQTADEHEHEHEHAVMHGVLHPSQPSSSSFARILPWKTCRPGPCLRRAMVAVQLALTTAYTSSLSTTPSSKRYPHMHLELTHTDRLRAPLLGAPSSSSDYASLAVVPPPTSSSWLAAQSTGPAWMLWSQP